MCLVCEGAQDTLLKSNAGPGGHGYYRDEAVTSNASASNGSVSKRYEYFSHPPNMTATAFGPIKLQLVEAVSRSTNSVYCAVTATVLCCAVCVVRVGCCLVSCLSIGWVT